MNKQQTIFLPTLLGIGITLTIFTNMLDSKVIADNNTAAINANKTLLIMAVIIVVATLSFGLCQYKSKITSVGGVLEGMVSIPSTVYAAVILLIGIVTLWCSVKIYQGSPSSKTEAVLLILFSLFITGVSGSYIGYSVSSGSAVAESVLGI